jgi:hypothetical protein
VHEDEAATLKEEEYLRSSANRPRQGTTIPPSIGRWQVDDPLPALQPADSTAGEEKSAISPVNWQATLPQYRGSVYWSSQYRDGPHNFRSTAPAEEDTELTRTVSSSSETDTPPYKLMSSVMRSVRRK